MSKKEPEVIESVLKRLRLGSTTEILDEAFYYAYTEARKSNDPSTQVGAAVLRDIEYSSVMGTGCNNFLPGVAITPERMTGINKLYYTEHAEELAVTKITANEFNRHVLVGTWAACSTCARLIVRSGIKTVVTDYRTFEFNAEHRQDDAWEASIHAAMDIFAESGVDFYAVKPDLKQFNLKEIRISGHLFQP